MSKLTNTALQAAKPKAKEYSLSDGQGLFLRIKPNGKKKWIFNYIKPYVRKRSNLALGEYPEVTLAQVRKLHAQAKELLRQDIDPTDHRKAKNVTRLNESCNTLHVVFGLWLNIKKTAVTAAYAEDIERSFVLHVFNRLGKVPVTQLTAIKVIDVLKPLEAKGSLETVKRICQRINEVMTYAVNTGLIHSNPLAGIYQAFQKPVKQNQLTLAPNELNEFTTTLQRANMRPTTRNLILWQLHTMTRPSEASGTQWNEINFKEKLWIIPAERMKKKREHVIPLTEQTLFILESMKAISHNSPFVFPSDRNNHKAAHSQTANAAIKRMGFDGRLVSHGLRALASTTLNEQGFDADVIEAALAHVDKNDVRRAYNRTQYLERRQVLMNWWSDHIDGKSSDSKKGLRLVNE